MMKFNKAISKARMNLTICFCIVAFPCAALSQNSASKAKTQSTTTGAPSEIQQTPTQAETKNFTGNWKLNEKQSDQRLRAIEKTVASMGRFKQARARTMLQKTTAPPQELKIVDSGGQIKLTRGGLDIAIPTTGKVVNVKGERGSISIKAGKTDGKLTIVSETDQATNISIYELSDDGQKLTQRVQLRSSNLPEPIEFANQFTR